MASPSASSGFKSPFIPTTTQPTPNKGSTTFKFQRTPSPYHSIDCNLPPLSPEEIEEEKMRNGEVEMDKIHKSSE